MSADPDIIFNYHRFEDVFVGIRNLGGVIVRDGSDRHMRCDQHAISDFHAAAAPDMNKTCDRNLIPHVNLLRLGKADGVAEYVTSSPQLPSLALVRRLQG